MDAIYKRPGRSKKARRRLTRGSTPLYHWQVMKRDRRIRAPVRSDNPRVESSTMLENNEAAKGSVSHLYAVKPSRPLNVRTWLFEFEFKFDRANERNIRPV